MFYAFTVYVYCETVWETYKAIFNGLEDAACQILRCFAEHSIPFGSGGKTPRMGCECEVYSEVRF